jgi:NodT family efflux transporter outer membrane factor (OMF) lipoprotein
MVGPRYEAPSPELAPAFSENEDSTGAVVDLKEWWAQFNDPVLNSMIEEAIEKNYDLRIAVERINETRARYNLASANLWPEIDVAGEVSRSRNSQTLIDAPILGPPVQNFFQLGFDASWEIDLFGRLRSIQSAAEYDLEASQENFRNIYVSLLAEICRNYAFYRSVQERIELTSRQIEVSIDSLQMAEVRYRAGIVSDIQPLQVKSELDSLKASLPPLEARKNESLYAISVLLGRAPEEIPESWLEMKPIPQAQGKIPLGLPSDLLKRRPDIRQAERLLAAATSRVGASIARLFPTFSLTAAFGYQSESSGNLFSPPSQAWSVGPNVFWPFIDFGRIRADIDFTKAVQREALLNYEKIVLEALQEVEDALVAYSKEELRLKSLSNQIDDLTEARNLTKALYTAGLESYSSLLDAEQQLLFAEQTLLTSEENLAEFLIAIYKSLGGDWPCSTTR